MKIVDDQGRQYRSKVEAARNGSEDSSYFLEELLHERIDITDEIRRFRAMTPMKDFERRLLDSHVCAETHSKAIAFARKVKVPDMLIANMLAAAVLRSNEEIDRFDEWERTQ